MVRWVFCGRDWRIVQEGAGLGASCSQHAVSLVDLSQRKAHDSCHVSYRKYKDAGSAKVAVTGRGSRLRQPFAAFAICTCLIKVWIGNVELVTYLEESGAQLGRLLKAPLLQQVLQVCLSDLHTLAWLPQTHAASSEGWAGIHDVQCPGLGAMHNSMRPEENLCNQSCSIRSGAERTFWWEEDLSEASVSRTLSASSNLACSMSQLTLSSPSLGRPTTMS